MHYTLGSESDTFAPTLDMTVVEGKKETPDTYKTVRVNTLESVVGTHIYEGVSMIRENPSNQAHFVTALKEVRNRFGTPPNSLSQWYMSGKLVYDMHTISYNDKHTITYKLIQKYAQTYSLPTYLNTLHQTYNVSDFLSLLALHEAAGLCLDGSPRYGIDPVTKLPLNYDFCDYNFTKPVTQKSGSTFFATMEKYNPVWTTALPSAALLKYESPTMMTSDLQNSKDYMAEKIDEANLPFYRYGTYQGYKWKNDIAYFLGQVAMFRERVLADLLGKTFFMLDVAKLEDEATVRTMFQYFDHAISDYNALDRQEDITLIDMKGLPIGYRTFKISDIKNIFLEMPNPLDPSKTTGPITILKALQLQYESCIWLILWNMNKLTGRVAQLGDITKTLMEQAPISWQSDPWNNPFLLFDAQASKTRGESTFVNEAKSRAYNPLKIATSSFVPLKNMLEAEKMYNQLHLAPYSPGGVYVKPAGATGDTTIAPFIFAAAAAGLIFYLQNK